jgi:hypothetical protein
VRGDRGQALAEVMGDEPEALKGIAAPGFPNYFFAAGPNGLVLQVPYFVTIERNIETIVRLLTEKQRADARAMVVRDEVHREYNDWLLTQFEIYSWGAASCNSYYQLPNGRAPFLFPGDFKTYEELHAQCGLHEFELV